VTATTPVLAAVIALTCLASCASLVYAPLAPFLVRELGLTYVAVGVLSSTIFLGAALGSAAAGRQVDRVGPTTALAASLAVMGAALGVSALLSSYAALVAAALVAGLGFALVNPAANAAVGSGVPRAARGTVMGIKQTGIAAGGILAGLWMPAAALWAGWRMALAQVAAALIATAGAIAARARRSRSALAAEASTAAGRGRGGRVPRTVSLWLGGFALSGSQALLMTYLTVFLTAERGVSAARSGALFAVLQASALSGRIALGVVSDRLLAGRRRPVLVGAAVVGAVGFAGLALVGGTGAPPVLVATVVVAGATAIGWNGVYMAALVDVAPCGSEGRTSGVGVAPNLLGVVVLPPCGGVLLDAGAPFAAVWLLAGGVALVAAASFWRFDARGLRAGVAR
jgi:MFS family permease